MSDPRPLPQELSRPLARATQALVRTVDVLTDDDLAAPSVLPGWSRAHVVAHLALNAEALGGVLDGVLSASPTTMYASQEVRDADIEALAAAAPDELRDRFLASTVLFADALERMPDDAWGGDFERTPGGVRFRLAAVPRMRQVEVEVHHADLDAGYGPEDWPSDFLDPLLDRLVADRAKETSFVLRLPDREVTVGDGGSTVVAGSPARVVWWLLGRGAGEGLRSDAALPTLGPWR